MQKAGVELIVEGLAQFGRDMERANSAVQSFGGNGTLLTRTFEGVGNALKSFGGHVLDVAKVALGVLLRDAILAVVDAVKELIGSIVEAGSEFQLLELRLNRLNVNWAMEHEGVENFAQAMNHATGATRDQLQWLQQLAVTTPYDAQDIANVYTLARSYSFADDRARSLTQSITNFAAGMGLGNQEIERIIINFGQLVQQGKLNGQELRDLARGAFVPVNDILTRMRENMGLTTEEFKKLRKAGGLTGDAVQEFIGAFEEIVSERFQGAAEGMARSWQGATDNVKDFFKSVLGLGVVKPILDKLGEGIAGLLDVVARPENFKLITDHVSRFGQAVARLVGDLLGLKGIDLEKLPEMIAGAFDKMTTWINVHKDDIFAFFQGIGETIRDRVVPFIQGMITSFNTIKDWVAENKDTILEFFAALGDIIADVLGLGGGSKGVKGESPLVSILDSIKNFMVYVIENKDQIAVWTELILKAFIAWQILATVISFVIGLVVAITGFILGLVAAVVGAISFLTVLGSVIGAVAAFLTGALIPGLLIGIAVFLALVGVAVIVFGAWLIMRNGGELFKQGLELVVARARELFEELKRIVKETVERIVTAFKEKDWPGIGEAVVNGIISGVKKAGGALISVLQDLVKKALDAAKRALGIKSPSTEFELVGRMTITGLAEGIQNNARKAELAMRDAIARVSAPALAMPSIMQSYSVAAAPALSNTYQTTNNWNLTVNSRAQKEQVVQDYNMMQSIAGA